MRRTPIILLTLMALAVTVSAPSAWGQLSPDYAWVVDELRKDPGQQNSALIDQKIASLIATASLDIGTYRDVRMIQSQRRVAGTAGKTAPERRQMMNEERKTVIADLARLYLKEEVTSADQRLRVFQMQLGIARDITNSQDSVAVESQVADALVMDTSTHYLAPAELTPEEKEMILKATISAVAELRNGEKRLGLLMDLYGRMLALGTPSTREAYVGRAKVKTSQGDIDGALADFLAVLDDPKATPSMKMLARWQRMQVLMNAQRWADAKADADELARFALDQATGGGLDAYRDSLARQDAARVRLAAAELNQDMYRAELSKLLVEVLATQRILADDKADRVAGILLELAGDEGRFYEWDKALGYARAAYNVSGNWQVPHTMTLIQQILANRSRGPLTPGDFSVTRKPEDIAHAEAFFARQSGSKTVEGKEIRLAADLSNQDQFPRQLDGLAVPFDADTVKALEQVAGNHPDAMTRALAQGVLNQFDAAIQTISKAVDPMGSDTGKLSMQVDFVARFVRGKFESVALANAFLESQVSGPAGLDGRAGTADDKPNPLAAGAQR